jgi:phospholipid/cholesterol/gamma-HCH transport system substrate-binding protein
METRANYVIVGLFTVLSLFAAFFFVYWTARYGDRAETAEVVIRIPGSAAGLGRGSAILFNGIRVGAVTRVFLDAQNPSLAIASGEIDSLTPLKPSTRAALGVQGLTGQAYIELKGGLATEPNLIDTATGPIEINADPSALNDVVDAARTLVNRANGVLTTVEGALEEIRAPLAATMRNAETFSGALASRTGDIDAFLKSAGDLAVTLNATGTRLDATLTQVDGLLASVDPEKIRSTVANVEALSARLAASGDDIEALVRSATEASNRAQAAISRVDALAAAVKPEDVSVIVADIKAASGGADEVVAAARTAATEAAALAKRLSGEADGISEIIRNAGELTARLNAASVRVEGVLEKADALLGGGEAGGAIDELRQTLAAYRRLADTLNARAPEIASGLARFTGSGLRDIQNLVGATQGSIQRIERAISDLSDNPQRIISGGRGEVRTFDGRNRR